MLPDPVSNDVPEAPEAAASNRLAAGGVGGVIECSFHVPYWGLTKTSERRAKAWISLETRFPLAVDCCSRWVTSPTAWVSGTTVWLVTWYSS